MISDIFRYGPSSHPQLHFSTFEEFSLREPRASEQDKSLSPLSAQSSHFSPQILASKHGAVFFLFLFSLLLDVPAMTWAFPGRHSEIDVS